MRYRKDLDTVELETEILWHRMNCNMGNRPLLLSESLSDHIVAAIKGVKDAHQNTHA